MKFKTIFLGSLFLTATIALHIPLFSSYKQPRKMSPLKLPEACKPTTTQAHQTQSAPAQTTQQKESDLLSLLVGLSVSK